MSSSGLKNLSKDELLAFVEQLVSEVSALGERVSARGAERAALREENVRPKGLKGRPKLKPSGMEQATNRPKGKRKNGKRAARDAFLGPMKTCQKLGVSYFDHLGHRLNIQGAPTVPPLRELVIAAKA